MTRCSLRLWFCLAVAVIAAAIGDPLVEFASNSGWFGRGNFTDHSNLDVLPALIAGVAFAIFHVALRVKRALADPGKAAPELLRASSAALRPGIAGLLPATFALQIAALFLMETAEQYAVYGHALGGLVWLGGPALVSVAVHAVLCAVVAVAIARTVRALAVTTLRVIRLVRALAAFPAHGARPIALRRRAAVSIDRSRPVLCRIGERAPPLLLA